MAASYIENLTEWLTARLPPRAAAPDERQLNQMLRVLAIWRSRGLAGAYLQKHGSTVLQGPFAGMDYVAAATEGALIPRLLGTYESELHPALARFAAEAPDCVIDVGCAEGYYAVGLARLMPGVVVHAFDINPKARVACAELAERNQVSERVIIGERFEPTGFEAFADRRCLVMVDIEGAEDDLLRPDLSPSLARMNLIVETHDVYRPGVLGRLMERFSATHHIERVELQAKTMPLPDWIRSLGHLDQLLAVWEFRVRPTPWLIMTPKS